MNTPGDGGNTHDRGEPTADAFRLAFALNPLPMWIYDVATLRILTVNEAACLQYGYTAEQMRALTADQLHTPPVRQNFVKELHLRAGLTTSGLHSTHLRSDGATLHVRLSAHPLTLVTGAARLVVIEESGPEPITATGNAVRLQIAEIDYAATVEAVTDALADKGPRPPAPPIPPGDETGRGGQRPGA